MIDTVVSSDRQPRVFRIADHVALGTAQFGLPYGRRRDAAPLSDTEARALLSAAWSHGVRHFDTAAAYGPAATRLSRWLLDTAHAQEAFVTTKIACDDALTTDAIALAVRPFDTCAGVAILSHSVTCRPAWDKLVAVGLTRGISVGRSVYEPHEIAAGVADGVSYFQALGNIFDMRCVNAAVALPCTLAIRSVYLQGTLLDSPTLAESRAPGCGTLAGAVQNAAAEVGYPPAALLLAGAVALSHGASRLVIGIDCDSDLDAMIAAEEIPAATITDFIACVRNAVPGPISPQTLDPRCWS
jgi:hypothetical protein